jgi:hypothetical protein
MGTDDFYAGKLPFMFKDWPEYRDYLIEKLTSNDPSWNKRLKRQSAMFDSMLGNVPAFVEKAARAVVQSILCNDYTGTKMDNFKTSFTGFYKRDRRDSMQWDEDDTFPRERDPISFKWYENRFRLDGFDRDGKRIYRRERYEYWAVGDTLHRNMVDQSAALAPPLEAALQSDGELL